MLLILPLMSSFFVVEMIIGFQNLDTETDIIFIKDFSLNTNYPIHNIFHIFIVFQVKITLPFLVSIILYIHYISSEKIYQ